MFDKFRLNEALTEYKKRFVQTQWPDEKYKWEAVKCFQINWDVNSDDFARMLTKALSQTGNLMASMDNCPAGIITKFAEIAQEEVRDMFIELFDESKEIYERINNFKQKSNNLIEKYGNSAEQHYQDENAISTYLWLRYPDKYYIYNFSEVKAVSNELESNYTFKKVAYDDNIHNFLDFYNEICAELQQDDEMKNLLSSQITGTCYPDPELRTLTIDVGFFISRYFSKKDDAPTTNEWWPNNYTPVKLYANLTPTFWKISHGTDCITDAEASSFDERRVVVVHKDTAAKGKTKVSQGEDFVANMKKGDFFYLCRGNSIRLLCRIETDEVEENPEKQDGWCERNYTVIAKSRDKNAYTGEKKWWTPKMITLRVLQCQKAKNHCLMSTSLNHTLI